MVSGLCCARLRVNRLVSVSAIGIRFNWRHWGTKMGLRELLLVAVVALVLYGRSGVLKSRQAQTILPWISPRRRTVGPQGQARPRQAAANAKIASSKPFLLRGNRLYWFLTILAATAVAALILTRAMIVGAASPGLTHWSSFTWPRARPLCIQWIPRPLLRGLFDRRNMTMIPFAFFGSLGPMEIAIVGLVCLLIFGNRLPSVMRSLGQSVTEFKKGISGVQEEIEQAVTADQKPKTPNSW
jgi:sec-independent protein translocase protein TatA